MKAFKRILTCLLAGAMLVGVCGFAACSPGAPEGTDPGNPSDNTNEFEGIDMESFAYTQS